MKLIFKSGVTMKTDQLVPTDYAPFFNDIKEKIRQYQLNAALLVNQELIRMYWDIGQMIDTSQQKEGWGSQTIDRLAKDLKKQFPGIKGFSLRNLQRMVRFSRSYDLRTVEQHVAKIPWGHNMVLLEKLGTIDERIWYAQKVIDCGWSRSVLEMWIKAKLHAREGQAITNFHRTLPSTQSNLAQQTLKDPYCFDFLALTDNYHEREVEQGLVDHIQKFLIELGAGFAFLGRQYPLVVDGRDYYLDLLFYHIKLRCFCVVDLKTTEFKPEYAGKMNFYLSAVDDVLKHQHDNPSIGMILCEHRQKMTVEYALRGINTPIGVSGYEVELAKSLPDNFRGSLPTIEEIERELNP